MPDSLYTPVHLRGLPELSEDEAVEYLHGVAAGELQGDRKVDPARLANALLNSGTAYTAALTGAVQRGLVNKLNDVPTVFDFGSNVGTGSASIDTAAWRAAADSGASFTVPHLPGQVHRLQQAVTLNKADGQRIIGGGAHVIATTPNSVFIMNRGVDSSREGLAITGLRIDGSALTAGAVLDVRNVGRWTWDEIRIYGCWNHCYIHGSNDAHIGRVHVWQVAGEYGLAYYGSGVGTNPGAIRSDGLWIDTLIQSMKTGAGAVGFVWDGNAHTVEVNRMHNTSFDRGIWIRNTSGGTIPVFGHFNRVANDFPQHEGVRIDAGWDFDFVNLHANNSYLSDNVYVGAAVPYDMVRIGHHQITNSQTGYGIRSDSARVQIHGKSLMTGNALGNLSGSFTASTPGAEWGADPTTGGASGFGASMNGNNRVLSWAPGSFRTFNGDTETEGLTVDGEVVYLANKNVWAFHKPVSVTDRIDFGNNTYMRRNSGTGAFELVVNGVLQESWGP